MESTRAQISARGLVSRALDHKLATTYPATKQNASATIAPNLYAVGLHLVVGMPVLPVLIPLAYGQSIGVARRSPPSLQVRCAVCPYRSMPNPSRSISGRRPETMSATARPQPQACVQPFDPWPTLT